MQSEFFSFLTYDNDTTTEELANKVKETLKTSRMVYPIAIESECDRAMVVYDRIKNKRCILDYDENKVYNVDLVLMIPYGDFRRKIDEQIDDDQLNVLLRTGRIPSSIVTRKIAVSKFNYCLRSCNKMKMMIYVKGVE